MLLEETELKELQYLQNSFKKEKNMLIQLIVMIMCLFTSCTYNVSMAHTEGSASNVGDDSLTPTNTITPTLDPQVNYKPTMGK